MTTGRLTDQQVDWSARAYVELQALGTERQSQPIAIIVAGQEGARNRGLVSDLTEDMDRKGGYIEISKESLSHAMPYGHTTDETGRLVAPWVNSDVERVSAAAVTKAAAERRNVVIEGLPRDTEAALKIARTLRDAGYRVELHAVAMNEQVSYERAVYRFEQEAAAGKDVRLTTRDGHDLSYHGTADTVRSMEYQAAVDRLVVYDRVLNAVHDRAPVRGEPVGAEVLDAARGQLTVYERVNLATRWDEIAESMERRSAPSAQLDAVATSLERAHYTMRSNGQAAETYDFDNPSERHRSRDLAAAYGEKLATAFQDGRLDQAIHFPELQRAFTAQAMARKFAERQTELPVERVVHSIDRKLANALRVGEELRPIAVRDDKAATQAAEHEGR